MNFERKKFLIILISPSGGGKSTIRKRILAERDDIEYSISYTTRPRRKGEIDGKDYYFITHAKFKDMIQNKEFVEYADVHGEFYGTSKKEIEKINNHGKYVIMDIDVQGAKSIIKSGIDNITIFLLPPSYKALRERLIKRDTESEKEIQTRLRNAETEISEIEKFEYLVINDSLDHAVIGVNKIIDAENNKINRYNNIKKSFYTNYTKGE